MRPAPLGETVRSTTLPRFLLLYAAMYAAFGVASPFLPALVNARGASGAAGARAERRHSRPPAHGAPRRAPRRPDPGTPRRAGGLPRLAAVVTLGYLPAQGFWPFLALSLGHAAALAPVTILADALALGAAVPPPGSGRRGFEYGWVRGTGSAAFIGGTLLAGQAVSAWGLDVIVGCRPCCWGAAVAARRVPDLQHAPQRPWARRPGWPAAAAAAIPPAGAGGRPRPGQPRHARRLCGDPLARGRREPGDGECALVGVRRRGGARVFLLGPALVTWLTPAGALVVAALAGLVRWAVMAQSAAVLALALVQPLHGLTFALLHLACMRLLARIVPPGLEGTAQALYGTVGIGATSAGLTLVSGVLYARVGAQGFGPWRRCARWRSP